MTKINIVNDLIRVIPFNEEEPWVEVDDETLQKIMQNKIVAKNGQLVDNTSNINAVARIKELKQQIVKFKEDVEQVELFGMERADYEEKKAQCVQIIEELRALEAQLKGE